MPTIPGYLTLFRELPFFSAAARRRTPDRQPVSCRSGPPDRIQALRSRWLLPRLLPEARLARADDRGRAGLDAELAQDVRDVVARGALADAEPLADSGVVEALRHQL